jgi:hypothetical protein
MGVVKVFKYGKRYRFAPLFNKREKKILGAV